MDELRAAHMAYTAATIGDDRRAEIRTASKLAEAVDRLVLGGDVPDHAIPLCMDGKRVRAAMPCQDTLGMPFRKWLVMIDHEPYDVDTGTLAKYSVGYARWAPMANEWRPDGNSRAQEAVSWAQALTWFVLWAADEVPTVPSE